VSGERDTDGIAGLREARRLLKNSKAHMDGSSADYARGWRDGLRHLDIFLRAKVNQALANRRSAKP